MNLTRPKRLQDLTREWLIFARRNGEEDMPSRGGSWPALILALACVVVWAGLWTPATGAVTGKPDPSGVALVKDTGTPPSVETKPPPKAVAVLAEIQKRNGAPPPGYVGGRTFRNRERRLPPGDYREYDVNPRIRGQDRGAERLVIERRTGKAYYTDDHYRTFIPMN